MAIFDIHHPQVFTFGILGNIISICVFFAPLSTFIKIYRRKSTLGFQSLPYVVALFSSMLWMYYAFIKRNATLLISVNLIGCFIETIYISLFLIYASNEARNKTLKLVALSGGMFTFILLFTFFVFKDSIRVQVVGWACVFVSVCVFAAPLSIVCQVVRTKSVEFMPFLLSFFLTLSAVMWFVYGLFQKDLCVALPNVFGFVLGVIQMMLYGIYRNTKKVVDDHDIEIDIAEIETTMTTSEKKVSAEQHHHITINVMLGGSVTSSTSEVHPVDAVPSLYYPSPVSVISPT